MKLDAARFIRALTVGGASVVLLLAVANPAQAQREDPGLQLACANDYFRLCAGIDSNSLDAETCMDRNRPRLSSECRAAIGDYNRRTGTRAAPQQR